MKSMDEGEGDDEEEEEYDEDVRNLDANLSLVEFKNKVINGFWLHNCNKDVDLRLARLDHLIYRRPQLANSVVLRQNPHNVEQWHQRVKLFEGNREKQIRAYADALRTVDPMKAVGKPHKLWVNFALLYENQKDLANARTIFNKAVQVTYKNVDDLVSVWCERVNLELRHKNSKGALELLKGATAEPPVEIKRRVAADGNEPVQMKLHKSLRLWSFYVDLVESLGTLEPAREVYEKIISLRISTPNIIINYACLLEEHKYFENAFKVYERGLKIFKYPHVKDIWVTYLAKFVKRYGKTKLEHSRELFERAIEMTPTDAVKPLYLQYVKLEEDFGTAKRALKIYDQARKAVPNNEKFGMYELYIKCVEKIFGVPKTREIYQQAIESGLPDKDMKRMCLKYAKLEKTLGEIDRARAILVFASQFSDPRFDGDFWHEWNNFEVQHGNEDTFREMLRVKRSVSASYSQTHCILPEYPAANDTTTRDGSRKVRFVSAGIESQSHEGLKVTANHEHMELPEEENDSEDDERVEIKQKDIANIVFRDMARKRKDTEDEPQNDRSHLGALERIKRLKRT